MADRPEDGDDDIERPSSRIATSCIHTVMHSATGGTTNDWASKEGQNQVQILQRNFGSMTK